MYVVISTQESGMVTIYGPFHSDKDAQNWRNGICDPQTLPKTNNYVATLHKPNDRPVVQ